MRTLIVALVLFAALCGLMLVFFGGEPPARADERRAEHRTRVALREVEDAERALNDQDYGRARDRVRRARQLLLGLDANDNN